MASVKLLPLTTPQIPFKKNHHLALITSLHWLSFLFHLDKLLLQRAMVEVIYIHCLPIAISLSNVVLCIYSALYACQSLHFRLCVAGRKRILFLISFPGARFSCFNFGERSRKRFNFNLFQFDRKVSHSFLSSGKHQT